MPSPTIFIALTYTHVDQASAQDLPYFSYSQYANLDRNYGILAHFEPIISYQDLAMCVSGTSYGNTYRTFDMPGGGLYNRLHLAPGIKYAVVWGSYGSMYPPYDWGVRSTAFTATTPTPANYFVAYKYTNNAGTEWVTSTSPTAIRLEFTCDG